jgi:cholesterol transport system auxiliary component
MMKTPLFSLLRRSAVLLSALTLAACSSLQPAPRQQVYDFGPGPQRAVVARGVAVLPPLGLPEVEASAALDSPALLYRLAYADVQELHPYAQARWSMPPAQLLRQRVREQLAQQRTVLSGPEANASSAPVLRLELEEFSQVFSSVRDSSALLRVRATLLVPGALRNTLRVQAQTTLVLNQPAGRPDAAAGVAALAQASDALALKLQDWLQLVQPPVSDESAPAAPATR